MIVIKDPKTFCFNFDFPKDVDQNLKLEIEFIIKSNECLAGNKRKKEIQKTIKQVNHLNLLLTCQKDWT